jgi:hypothetical protein
VKPVIRKSKAKRQSYISESDSGSLRLLARFRTGLALTEGFVSGEESMGVGVTGAGSETSLDFFLGERRLQDKHINKGLRRRQSRTHDFEGELRADIGLLQMDRKRG